VSLLLSINQDRLEGVPVPFGVVIERYLAQELPEGNSTASRYHSRLKSYVKPNWAECLLDQIKPLLVEDWLRKPSLAPKSKSHLKNLMHVSFNAAMRSAYRQDRKNTKYAESGYTAGSRSGRVLSAHLFGG
jgi:integrase